MTRERIGKAVSVLFLMAPVVAVAQGWPSGNDIKPIQELMLMTHDELLREAKGACVAFNLFSTVDLTRTGQASDYLQTIKRVERSHFGTTKGVDAIEKEGLRFGGTDSSAVKAELCKTALADGLKAISANQKPPKHAASPPAKSN